LPIFFYTKTMHSFIKF